MSEVLRDRTMHKYYQCLVVGQMRDAQRIEGYLWKNPASNTVTVSSEERPDAQQIITEYRPIRMFNDCTLLEVCLITGRSHQIRAHLASIGHPIIGDYKYGMRNVNDRYRKRYGLTGQLLHSCRLELPRMKAPMENLSGRTFTAELPNIMKRILDDSEQET